MAAAPAGDAIVAFALPRADEAGPGLLSLALDRPGGRFAARAVALLPLALLAWVLLRVRRAYRRKAGPGA